MFPSALFNPDGSSSAMKNAFFVVLFLTDVSFPEAKRSQCGNMDLEAGEQCDSFLIGAKPIDQCCDTNCRLVGDAQCRCLFCDDACLIAFCRNWFASSQTSTVCSDLS